MVETDTAGAGKIGRHPTPLVTAITEVIEADARPRRKFGKWAQQGVPHTGWRCINVVDHRAPNHTCQMCESQQARYVHRMEHDEYPEVLEVGCDCAGYMQQDHQEAKNRERTLKNRGQRRAKWPTRKWRESANSNLWLRTQGYRVVIRRTGPGWTFTLARDDGPTHHAAATFRTSDEAKLAAFDFIWPAVSRVA